MFNVVEKAMRFKKPVSSCIIDMPAGSARNLRNHADPIPLYDPFALSEMPN